jgi:ABC-type transport system involved in multi-copper enzyme maturation permease subunit
MNDTTVLYPWRFATAAAWRRELASHQVNRFLQAHLTLAVVAGLLPLLTMGNELTAAPWWLLQAVLYGLSLSALLLGLSSAHGESDELALIFAQPISRGAWLAGKAIGLAAVLLPAAVLLVLPVALRNGVTWSLASVAASAAGVTLVMALLGLALGSWVRDGVRGLIAGLGVWLFLLAGVDLIAIALAATPIGPSAPDVIVALMMANPLDSLRVGYLFALEQAAPAGLDKGGLSAWWVTHSALWLVMVLAVWCAGAFAAGLRSLHRSVDA